MKKVMKRTQEIQGEQCSGARVFKRADIMNEQLSEKTMSEAVKRSLELSAKIKEAQADILFSFCNDPAAAFGGKPGHTDLYERGIETVRESGNQFVEHLEEMSPEDTRLLTDILSLNIYENATSLSLIAAFSPHGFARKFAFDLLEEELRSREKQAAATWGSLPNSPAEEKIRLIDYIVLLHIVNTICSFEESFEDTRRRAEDIVAGVLKEVFKKEVLGEEELFLA